MSKIYSQAEIDGLLAEVDVALAKATALAKSQPMKKDDEAQPDMPADEQAAGQTDAEPMDMPSDEPAPATAAAPEQEAAPAPEQEAGMEPDEQQAPQDQEMAPEGEESLQQEGQEGQEMSDEELQEIYGQMQDEELERHFMVIRSVLQQKMGNQQDQAEQPQEQQPAPQSEAQPEFDQSAPAMKQEMMSEHKEANGGKMSKSEDFAKAEIESLKKKNAELEQGMATAIKAMEIAFRPRQKALTGVNFLNKSESDAGDAVRSMSKAEKISKLGELTKTNKLTSEQRGSINSFILRGDEEEKINQILGGK